MAIFRGPLKPDDPLYRTGFLIMHPRPYSPGGKKPGTNFAGGAEARPKKPEAARRPGVHSAMKAPKRVTRKIARPRKGKGKRQDGPTPLTMEELAEYLTT
jgi:hypothetical protein